jgi:Tfp pilus assembly protein PilW
MNLPVMPHRVFRHVQAVLREESGFSLIELLAVIPLMLLVFFTVFNLYDVSVREQDRGESRVRSLVQQKNGLERMSRELRDAFAVKYQTSEIIDAQMASGGRWLRYDCSGTTCRRSEGPTQGTFDKGPVTMISGVQSAEFQTLSSVGGTFQPDFVNPTYVTVTLRVSVKGANNPIVLNDGFNLRNLTNPS